MKRIGFYCVLLSMILTSCEEKLESSQYDGIALKNGRLVFRDAKVFYSTIDKLNIASTDSDSWMNQSGFESIQESLENTPDAEGSSDLSYLPSSYQMVINSKGEIQIGDTIIWFNNGLKHYVLNEDETRLAEVKRNPAKSSLTSNFIITRVPFGKDHSEERIELTIGGLDARHQREFNYMNDPK